LFSACSLPLFFTPLQRAVFCRFFVRYIVLSLLITLANIGHFFAFSEPFEVNNIGCFHVYYLPVCQVHVRFFYSVTITRKSLLGFGGIGKEKGCISAPILYLKYVGYSK